MKFNWINKGKEFTLPKMTIGTLKNLLIAQARPENAKLSEELKELNQLTVLVTDLLQRVDEKITHQIVDDNMGFEEIAIFVNELSKANPTLAVEGGDFQKMLDALKKK